MSWAAIGAALGQALGTGISNSSANSKAKRAEQRNYAFQREMQDKQLAWEKEKFQTQYQAAVKDLKAAGLNPVLAALNGGNTAGSIGGGTGTDVAGHVAAQGATNMSNALNSALDRAETMRINNSTIDQQNANAELMRTQAEGNRLNNKWINPKEAKQLKKMDAEIAMVKKETELKNLQKERETQTFWYDVQGSIGKAAEQVANGYLAKKEEEAMRTLGFSRKELFQLGETGIKLVGNLINIGAGWGVVKKVSKQIMKNNKSRQQTPLRGHRGTWEGYTPNPYERFSARNTY